jgi:DeoR family fructose operon transcriptional repressor
VRLLPEARRERVVEVVGEHRMIAFAELAQAVGVSVDTVRRDVDALSAEGRVQRTRGGALVPVVRPRVSPIAHRLEADTPGKHAIAREAATLIPDGATLALNGGSTVLAFAEALSEHRGLTILTNNLRVPSAVAPTAAADVFLLGGRVNRDAAATVGVAGAFGGERPPVVDYAVVGVGGLSAERGLSMGDPDEAAGVVEMMTMAGTTIVLCDAQKFGREAFAVVAPLDGFHVLVTDERPSGALARALQRAGVVVAVAGTAS